MLLYIALNLFAQFNMFCNKHIQIAITLFKAITNLIEKTKSHVAMEILNVESLVGS